MFDADVSLNGSDRTKSEQHIMQEAVVSCAMFAGQKDSVGQSITHSRNGSSTKVGT